MDIHADFREWLTSIPPTLYTSVSNINKAYTSVVQVFENKKSFPDQLSKAYSLLNGILFTCGFPIRAINSVSLTPQQQATIRQSHEHLDAVELQKFLSPQFLLQLNGILKTMMKDTRPNILKQAIFTYITGLFCLPRRCLSRYSYEMESFMIDQLFCVGEVKSEALVLALCTTTGLLGIQSDLIPSIDALYKLKRRLPVHLRVAMASCLYAAIDGQHLTKGNTHAVRDLLYQLLFDNELPVRAEARRTMARFILYTSTKEEHSIYKYVEQKDRRAITELKSVVDAMRQDLHADVGAYEDEAEDTTANGGDSGSEVNEYTDNDHYGYDDGYEDEPNYDNRRDDTQSSARPLQQHAGQVASLRLSTYSIDVDALPTPTHLTSTTTHANTHTGNSTKPSSNESGVGLTLPLPRPIKKSQSQSNTTTGKPLPSGSASVHSIQLPTPTSSISVDHELSFHAVHSQHPHHHQVATPTPSTMSLSSSLSISTGKKVPIKMRRIPLEEGNAVQPMQSLDSSGGDQQHHGLATPQSNSGNGNAAAAAAGGSGSGDARPTRILSIRRVPLDASPQLGSEDLAGGDRGGHSDFTTTLIVSPNIKRMTSPKHRRSVVNAALQALPYLQNGAPGSTGRQSVSSSSTTSTASLSSLSSSHCPPGLTSPRLKKFRKSFGSPKRIQIVSPMSGARKRRSGGSTTSTTGQPVAERRSTASLHQRTSSNQLSNHRHSSHPSHPQRPSSRATISTLPCPTRSTTSMSGATRHSSSSTMSTTRGPSIGQSQSPRARPRLQKPETSSVSQHGRQSSMSISRQGRQGSAAAPSSQLSRGGSGAPRRTAPSHSVSGSSTPLGGSVGIKPIVIGSRRVSFYGSVDEDDNTHENSQDNNQDDGHDDGDDGDDAGDNNNDTHHQDALNLTVQNPTRPFTLAPTSASISISTLENPTQQIQRQTQAPALSMATASSSPPPSSSSSSSSSTQPHTAVATPPPRCAVNERIHQQLLLLEKSQTNFRCSTIASVWHETTTLLLSPQPKTTSDSPAPGVAGTTTTTTTTNTRLSTGSFLSYSSLGLSKPSDGSSHLHPADKPVNQHASKPFICSISYDNLLLLQKCILAELQKIYRFQDSSIDIRTTAVACIECCFQLLRHGGIPFHLNDDNHAVGSSGNSRNSGNSDGITEFAHEPLPVASHFKYMFHNTGYCTIAHDQQQQQHQQQHQQSTTSSTLNKSHQQPLVLTKSLLLSFLLPLLFLFFNDHNAKVHLRVTHVLDFVLQHFPKLFLARQFIHCLLHDFPLYQLPIVATCVQPPSVHETSTDVNAAPLVTRFLSTAHGSAAAASSTIATPTTTTDFHGLYPSHTRPISCMIEYLQFILQSSREVAIGVVDSPNAIASLCLAMSWALFVTQHSITHQERYVGFYNQRLLLNSNSSSSSSSSSVTTNNRNSHGPTSPKLALINTGVNLTHLELCLSTSKELLTQLKKTCAQFFVHATSLIDISLSQCFSAIQAVLSRAHTQNQSKPGIKSPSHGANGSMPNNMTSSDIDTMFNPLDTSFIAFLVAFHTSSPAQSARTVYPTTALSLLFSLDGMEHVRNTITEYNPHLKYLFTTSNKTTNGCNGASTQCTTSTTATPHRQRSYTPQFVPSILSLVPQTPAPAPRPPLKGSGNEDSHRAAQIDGLVLPSNVSLIQSFISALVLVDSSLSRRFQVGAVQHHQAHGHPSSHGHGTASAATPGAAVSHQDQGQDSKTKDPKRISAAFSLTPARFSGEKLFASLTTPNQSRVATPQQQQQQQPTTATAPQAPSTTIYPQQQQQRQPASGVHTGSDHQHHHYHHYKAHGDENTPPPATISRAHHHHHQQQQQQQQEFHYNPIKANQISANQSILQYNSPMKHGRPQQSTFTPSQQQQPQQHHLQPSSHQASTPVPPYSTAIQQTSAHHVTRRSRGNIAVLATQTAAQGSGPSPATTAHAHGVPPPRDSTYSRRSTELMSTHQRIQLRRSIQSSKQMELTAQMSSYQTVSTSMSTTSIIATPTPLQSKQNQQEHITRHPPSHQSLFDGIRQCIAATQNGSGNNNAQSAQFDLNTVKYSAVRDAFMSLPYYLLHPLRLQLASEKDVERASGVLRDITTWFTLMLQYSHLSIGLFDQFIADTPTISYLLTQLVCPPAPTFAASIGASSEMLTYPAPVLQQLKECIASVLIFSSPQEITMVLLAVNNNTAAPPTSHAAATSDAVIPSLPPALSQHLQAQSTCNPLNSTAHLSMLMFFEILSNMLVLPSKYPPHSPSFSLFTSFHTTRVGQFWEYLRSIDGSHRHAPSTEPPQGGTMLTYCQHALTSLERGNQMRDSSHTVHAAKNGLMAIVRSLSSVQQQQQQQQQRQQHAFVQA